MRLQSIPARQGAAWVRQAFQVFFRQPLGFAGLFATLLFLFFVSPLLPFGALFMLVLMPLASLGFMIATQQALEGRWPSPLAFAEPLRSGKPAALALLRLGLVYALATWAVVTISEWADGGALTGLMQAQASGTASSEDIARRLADPRLKTGVFLRLGLLALLSLLFWHAPALVHWGRQGTLRALFFSSLACWRNKGAFLVYMLTWFGAFVLLGLVANLLSSLLGRSPFVQWVAMPAALVFFTVFYASLYFTFADCFTTAPDDPPSDRVVDA
jgi:hypothetical protein